MERKRRVVITGMGVVSPLGSSLEAFWQRLVSGCSAIRTIQRFDASAYPTQIAAEIPETEGAMLAPEYAKYGRIARFAIAAAENAMVDSGLNRLDARRKQVGVVVAGGLGTYGHEEVFGSCAAAVAGADRKFDRAAFIESLQRGLKQHAASRRSPGSIAAWIAARYGFQGPVMAVMTACAAGTEAIGDAARWIRMNRADIVLTGGADSELYPMGLASFCLLGALSMNNHAPSDASRPFDAGRDGFVIGEGAGMLVLEGLEHALRRGARIYAEVAGFGSAGDAYRVTDPHPEGLGARLAMQRALRDAGVGPSQVHYINAHGTSTPANDRIETAAIKQVFGSHAGSIAVSSTKSMIGHLTVAAGAVEAIATALTLKTQVIHPTINYQTADPECDLDYVPNHSRPSRVETALSNSFGFGGQCATLLLRAYPTQEKIDLA